jgi:hypothetical protein
MTAILNAGYVVDARTPAPLNVRNFYPHIMRGSDHLRVAKAFRDLGYRVYFSGNWYGRCHPIIFRCLSGQDYALSYSLSVFFTGTPFPLAVRDFNSMRHWGNKQPPEAAFDADWNATHPFLREFPRLLQEGGPQFVFIHNIPPHPPAIYTAQCGEIPGGGAFGLAWQYGTEPYRSSLSCVNRQIKELVRAIILRDPGAIVVIQSDHGSFTATPKNLVPENASPLSRFEVSRPINFIRAPDSCRQWLYRGITQINTMRFALACAQDGVPRYLSDISYADTSKSNSVHGPFVRQEKPPFPSGVSGSVIKP